MFGGKNGSSNGKPATCLEIKKIGCCQLLRELVGCSVMRQGGPGSAGTPRDFGPSVQGAIHAF